MTILFCNVGWMESYNGIDGDILSRGGAFNDHSIGHEVCNFTNLNEKVFGYVRSSGKIDIQKLGANKDDEFVDEVTVVWTAGPDSGGTVVIGWYENAKVYKEPQKLLKASGFHEKNKLDFYLIEANFSDAYLVPLQKRNLLIPRAVKGGIGQSNVWYAQSPEAQNLVQRVQKYISNKTVFEDMVDVDHEIIGVEGNPRFRTHLVRERNREIVQQKKKTILAQAGKLECEVCTFNFKAIYGEIGNNFCEVHHLIPLNQADGLVETKLDDLAIVCSNCHRMLHKGKPLLKIEELKKIIGSIR
ncbi:HNH endonuclease [Acinetobacter harbinensis]|uniref:HNH endonuclease n=2 Tax=Acinetobacter harbinensis TaxID=1353941 RepID=UPI00057F2CCA|nr:HNH endonuclease [Acinetobacter harbinensis]KWQ05811.1 HNH endonuclease [Acinetobacter harbinensis]